MTKFTVCLLAATIVVGAMPAAAAQAESVSAAINVRDLDFTKLSDIARFDRRVRQEAKSICNVGGRVTLSQHLAQAGCRSGVIASAERGKARRIALAKARSEQRLASR